jgi:amino acid permease
LTKAAIGAGMLFLPWNMHRMGLLMGVGSIIFAGCLCSTTLHYLARICANTGADDYFKLGRLAFGPVGEMTAVAALLFNLLGGLINYANFAGDYLSSSLVFLFGLDAPTWYISPSFLKVAIAAFGIFPLSCLRDMSALAKSSLAGLACMAYILLLTIVDFFVDSTHYQPPRLLPHFSTQFFSAFGSIIFAFVNHFTIVAIVPVMVEPSPARRSQMILFSNSTVIAVYLSAAIFGYLHFGSSINPIKPDILNSPDSMTIPYAIAKLAFASVMVCSYPLLCHPARSALDQLICRVCVGSSPTRAQKWVSMAQTRHYCETIVLVAVPTAIAVFAADLAALFLDVFSSLCGSLIVFVFPALYFLKLAQPKLYNFRVHRWERAFVGVNVFVGISVAIMGTFDSVKTMARVLMG